MATLADLLERPNDERVFIAAFPLEDTSKTLEEVFPPSWVKKDGEQTIIPLLLAPPEIVEELCKAMHDAGELYLEQYLDSKIPDIPTDAA